MLKDAIQQVTDMNPDMSVQKIEIRTNTETWANDTHLAQSTCSGWHLYDEFVTWLVHQTYSVRQKWTDFLLCSSFFFWQ